MIKSTLDSIIDQIASHESSDNTVEETRSRYSSSSNLSVTNPFSNHNNSNATINDGHSENGDYTFNNLGLEIKTLEETDAFLIFRSLCK